MRKRNLIFRISYEPNRLANTHLSDAYEKLIQIIKHRTNTEKKIDGHTEINRIQQQKDNHNENSRIIRKGVIR
jgi:hypothetical protein